MPPKNKDSKPEKPKLHPRNRNRERYDLGKLSEACPELAPFVTLNVHNSESIDFANPDAVKTLNKAILKFHYGIDHWEIPPDYLCPPIPGRADYIHHIADLLCASNFGKMPRGQQVKCLDIGVGANCIYPVIGVKEYGWSFIGSDIDPVSLKSAQHIVDSNPALKDHVALRLQENPKDHFYGVLRKEEIIDLSICNPPFHDSREEAEKGTLRKLKNLKKPNAKVKVERPVLNFGGQHNELWYKGGEERFIDNMIRQSKKFRDSCFWFSTLVAKQTHLRSIYGTLKEVQATQVETIPMGQGNKSSRIVAWTFLTKQEKIQWSKTRWTTPDNPGENPPGLR